MSAACASPQSDVGPHVMPLTRLPRPRPSPAQPPRPQRKALAVAAAAARPRLAVVGAGVVGLTCAARLLQDLPGAELTVIAEKFGADTTTFGAAGIWGPYKLSDTPDELVHRWGKDTFTHLMRLFYSREATQAGVSLCTTNWLYEDANEPAPFWHDIVWNWSSMDPRHLAMMPPHIKAAHTHTNVVCEGRYYLRWLEQRITSMGGTLQQAQLSSLGDVRGYDVIVNACGLGASKLVPDSKCYPIRGQIMRVRAPWVTQAYMAGDHYIIPNRGAVVLGGTGQVGDWNTGASLEDRRRLFAGCCAIVPSLTEAEVESDWVGLRPGRTSLRLELEPAAGAGAGAPVVHCYGHGGAGLTLAWGCAADVVALAKQALG